MYRDKRITVIIPCLDEERGIAEVLRRVPPIVDEVIVVDNGSTDRTADVARALGATVIVGAISRHGRRRIRSQSFRSRIGRKPRRI